MTKYFWPTWADIISKEFKESYNFGKSGAGNMFIALQIAEANQRYNFNRDDLVMVMWSGITREDRYVNQVWQTPGNIYTQNYYDDTFIKKYTDVRGYLIRDLGLISLTQQMLKRSNCEFHMLQMNQFVEDPSNYYSYSKNDPKQGLSDVIDLYKDLLDSIKPDLLTVGCNGKWPQVPIYHNENQQIDYHPTPDVHLSYLQQIFLNLPLSEETIKWVGAQERIVRKAKRIDNLPQLRSNTTSL